VIVPTIYDDYQTLFAVLYSNNKFELALVDWPVTLSDKDCCFSKRCCRETYQARCTLLAGFTNISEISDAL
jgi:hypothetical protein